MTEVTTSDAARAPRSGTRAVLFVVFAAFAGAVIFAMVTLLGKLHIVTFSTNVALVLLTFGLFKIAIATHAIFAPTAVSPQSDQRQDVGSPGVFKIWIAYKLAPAALAIVAAIYLFAVGSPALDALVR